MLYIRYDCDDSLWRIIDIDFPEFFEMSWLSDPVCLDIIKGVDNAEWNGASMVSTVDGTLFEINGLSTGTKALLLLYKLDDVHMSSVKFGDNCSPYLLEIAKLKDISIYIEHNLHFPEDQFRAYSVLKGREYTSYEEYVREYLEVL